MTSINTTIAIVSVGMFEHVGPKNYDTYFSIADRCLKPDGLFLLHTIGSNKGMSVDPWINKYIFPERFAYRRFRIAEASESRFVMEDWHNFGSDYDKTLMAWHGVLIGHGRSCLHVTPPPSEECLITIYAPALGLRARDIELWRVLFSRGVEGASAFIVNVLPDARSASGIIFNNSLSASALNTIATACAPGSILPTSFRCSDRMRDLHWLCSTGRFVRLRLARRQKSGMQVVRLRQQ